MMMWETRDRAEALEVFQGWYSWAIRSQLEPMKQVARMIKAHLDGSAERHRARASRTPRLESINSVIQLLKKSARGYRNRKPLPHRHLLPPRRTRPLPRFTHVPHETLKSPPALGMAGGLAPNPPAIFLAAGTVPFNPLTGARDIVRRRPSRISRPTFNSLSRFSIPRNWQERKSLVENSILALPWASSTELLSCFLGLRSPTSTSS